MYIFGTGTRKITVPTGQYITVSTLGETQTIVGYEVPFNAGTHGAHDGGYIEVGRLTNDAKTYGPYTTDLVFVIEANGSETQVVVGSMNSVDIAPIKTFGTYTPIKAIVPAATFVTPAISDGGTGTTVLTSAGAHGLTSAVAVGKSLYITWTGGTATSGFYPITAIDTNTTGVAITITLAYSAGLGTPTVSLAGSTITFASHTVSANTLKAGSVLDIEGLFSCSASASKTITITYDGVDVMSFPVGATTTSLLTNKRVCQCTPAQILTNAADQPGFGASTSAVVRSSVDATVDNVFAVKATIGLANSFVTLESYKTTISY